MAAKRKTLRVDFHTHPLADRYYCSFTSPRVPAQRDADDITEFLAAAAKRDIDAVAVTDHDCVASGWFAKRVAEQAGLDIIVIPGVELTTNWNGWRAHVLAYNIREDLPPNTLTPWDAVEEVHARGGVAVLAHPARDGERGPEIFLRCLEAGLDGVEVRNRMNGNFDAARWLGRRSRWRERFVLQTAGTDWHWYGMTRFLDVWCPDRYAAEVPVTWLVEKGLVLPEEAEAALERKAKRRRKGRTRKKETAVELLWGAEDDPWWWGLDEIMPEGSRYGAKMLYK